LDLQGFLRISEEVPVGYKNINIHFKIEADLSEEQKDELLKMARSILPFSIVP
jgi:uncharacterized OsmC-like protein